MALPGTRRRGNLVDRHPDMPPRVRAEVRVKLIFATLVPGWTGRPLPEAMPTRTRLALYLSFTLADLAAIVRHGRTFTLLAPNRREALMQHLAGHRLAWVRRIVQQWKTMALLTR
jgi:hypothetical protein